MKVFASIDIEKGAGLGYGHAVMSTDTGHNSVSGNGTWAYHNEGAVLDWGYRAMHGSVVLAKELTTAYYSNEILYSYYSGCSTGGSKSA
jgi:feruloyl esterase